MNETDRFRAVFRQSYADVVRFAQRRTSADRAEDIAAETFLVAWRRVDDLPSTLDDARAWLFGISRNVLLNERRGQNRTASLAVRLADVSAALPQQADTAEIVATRMDIATAWSLLSDAESEVLGLSVFDQLSSEHAAQVLGISAGAFRVRLSRARATLRQHLADSQSTTHLKEVLR